MENWVNTFQPEDAKFTAKAELQQNLKSGVALLHVVYALDEQRVENTYEQ